MQVERGHHLLVKIQVVIAPVKLERHGFGAVASPITVVPWGSIELFQVFS